MTAADRWTDRWAPLGTFPSTPGRLSVSLVLFAIMVVKAIIVWKDPPGVLASVLLVALGLDLGQYLGKRLTDGTYIAKKAKIKGGKA